MFDLSGYTWGASSLDSGDSCGMEFSLDRVCGMEFCDGVACGILCI